MQDVDNGDGSIGVAVVAWVAVFFASWVLISAFTGATGLALVWGVFTALLGFEISRHSFRRGLMLIFLSLFVVLLRGLYAVIS
jgi:hypothetical protein